MIIKMSRLNWIVSGKIVRKTIQDDIFGKFELLNRM